jgi:hypothetical protein
MKKVLITILILLIVLDIVWLITYLFATPIDLIDEGQFAAWTSHMLHGKKMYEDIYITYGPLYVYVVYLFLKISHASLQGIRTFLFVLNFITCIPVAYLLLSNLKLKKLTIFSALSFLFLLLPIFSVRQALGLLAVFLQMNMMEKNRTITAFLLGVTIGIAFLFSPDIGLYSFAVILIANLFPLMFSRNIFYHLRKLMFIILGLVVVGTIFSIWAQGEGWLTGYISTTLDVLTTLSGVNSPIGQKYPNFFELFPKSLSPVLFLKFIFSKQMMLYWIFLFNIILVFVSFYTFLSKKINRTDKKIYLLYLFCLLLSTTLIGRNGIGHVFFVLPPIIIILFIFLEHLFENSHKKISGGLRFVIIAIILLFLFRLTLIYRPTYFEIMRIKSFLTKDYKNNDLVGVALIDDAPQIEKLKKFIDHNTDENDPIFLLKDEPGIYMILNRINPTRYDLPFIADSLPKRYEIVNQLKSSPVKYIIDNTLAWDVDGISNRQRIPELDRLLNRDFYRCDIIGKINIYCKK